MHENPLQRTLFLSLKNMHIHLMDTVPNHRQLFGWGRVASAYIRLIQHGEESMGSKTDRMQEPSLWKRHFSVQIHLHFSPDTAPGERGIHRKHPLGDGAGRCSAFQGAPPPHMTCSLLSIFLHFLINARSLPSEAVFSLLPPHDHGAHCAKFPQASPEMYVVIEPQVHSLSCGAAKLSLRLSFMKIRAAFGHRNTHHLRSSAQELEVELSLDWDQND